VNIDSPSRLRRREFFAALGVGALIPLLARAGETDAVAAAFDREVEGFMAARAIPGGALAVLKDGRLVYARGYGWADRERQIRVRPDSLFRIASVSKPITAAAVLQLIENKALDLDARAFPFLKLEPLQGKKPEPRLARIAIRQLLQHTGGWDRERSGDPMFRATAIARAANVPSPPGARDVIRYMLGRKLDFDPGQRCVYSNFGYCVLGRIIEEVTGRHYEAFVQEKVLAPIGIREMRIGRSLDSKQADNEVRYYARENESAKSVFDQGPRKVPLPYGGFCLEAMDAHGGWLASVVDLARFAAAFDEHAPHSLLKPETIRVMQARPPAPVSRKRDGSLEEWFYGCGWAVRPVGAQGKVNCWHAGSLPGTATLLVRRWDGLSWAALFNQRSEDKKLPDSAIDPALHRAADAVLAWPTRDLLSTR
jgi:N-acyl-D-amino-acid deacylase